MSQYETGTTINDDELESHVYRQTGNLFVTYYVIYIMNNFALILSVLVKYFGVIEIRDYRYLASTILSHEHVKIVTGVGLVCSSMKIYLTRFETTSAYLYPMSLKHFLLK